MRRRMKSLLLGGALAALTLVPGSPAQGAPTGHSNGHSNVHAMKVFVGYADGIRGAVDAVEGAVRRFSRLPLVAQGVSLALAFFLIEHLRPKGVAPFIYFQF